MAAPAIKGRVPKSSTGSGGMRDANAQSMAVFIDTFVNKIDELHFEGTVSAERITVD